MLVAAVAAAALAVVPAVGLAVALVVALVVLLAAVLFSYRRYTFAAAVAAAVEAVVAPVAALVAAVLVAVEFAVVALVVVGLAAAAVALAVQQLGQPVFVAVEVYWEEDPCAVVDVVTSDSFGRRLCHIYRIRAIVCGSYRPYGVVDAGISRVSARNHDRNRDKCVVLVWDLFPLVVMFVLHRAYD